MLDDLATYLRASCEHVTFSITCFFGGSKEDPFAALSQQARDFPAGRLVTWRGRVLGEIA